MSLLAEEFLNKKEYTKLENHFASTLKTSTDVKLFRIYILYVTSQGKNADLIKVYEFILKKLYHHWDVYQFLIEYIQILREDQNIDEEEKIEKIRSAYHIFFLTPMNNFNLLWKEYDKFENDLNKTTAKKIFTEILPVYQKTFRLYTLYKTLLSYSPRLIQDTITSDLFFDVVELEERDVAYFKSDHLKERMNFIFKFFSERFQNEEIYFTWAEYLKRIDKIPEALLVVKNGIKNITGSIFLYCYYSTITKEEMFREIIEILLGEDKTITSQDDDLDIIIINYLAYTLKNSGLESFRDLFREFITQEIGPYVYIYAGKAEYFTFQNKEISFRIFTKALQKFPNHEALQQEFMFFLLETNDLVNARAFFERFTKTPEVCEAMMRCEFLYGDNDKYREVLQSFNYNKKPEKSLNELIKDKNKHEKMFLLFKNQIFYFKQNKKENMEVKNFIEKISTIDFPVIKSEAVIEILKKIEI